jgi:hypothetical protein
MPSPLPDLDAMDSAVDTPSQRDMQDVMEEDDTSLPDLDVAMSPANTTRPATPVDGGLEGTPLPELADYNVGSDDDGPLPEIEDVYLGSDADGPLPDLPTNLPEVGDDQEESNNDEPLPDIELDDEDDVKEETDNLPAGVAAPVIPKGIITRSKFSCIRLPFNG